MADRKKATQSKKKATQKQTTQSTKKATLKQTTQSTKKATSKKKASTSAKKAIASKTFRGTAKFIYNPAGELKLKNIKLQGAVTHQLLAGIHKQVEITIARPPRVLDPGCGPDPNAMCPCDAKCLPGYP